MLRLERPPEPAGFEARTLEPRTAVERAIGQGEAPEFPDAWGADKPVLIAAQHGKCGYCESKVLATGTGQVDHYRPKAAVAELGMWGEEAPSASNVVGRDTSTKVCKPGYWWLAYRWDNYVFACERCNVGWKRDLFPVERRRPLRPGVEKEEGPLLLDPYGKENPAKHLLFDVWGNVEPRGLTTAGLETIRTLGLDRESLVEDRSDLALTIHELVRELRRAGDDAEKRDALLAIHRNGDVRRPHAGMVRAVFEVEYGRTWGWLEAEVARAR